MGIPSCLTAPLQKGLVKCRKGNALCDPPCDSSGGLDPCITSTSRVSSIHTRSPAPKPVTGGLLPWMTTSHGSLLPYRYPHNQNHYLENGQKLAPCMSNCIKLKPLIKNICLETEFKIHRHIAADARRRSKMFKDRLFKDCSG